ncbi:hypothetical protein [Saccharothrix longispora]|uniref:hypothetical protein n=1 Tax=Saccharothrix longispora TaxID=33920 RepID=UPI0028FD94D3|nr:hypothetical protein [Saccharothrix longispora]MDU0294418.1 hypothetical protein [Saccharothrix longispora]
MGDNARDLSSARCPTCGSWTLEKRRNPYMRVVLALLRVAYRIIVWRYLGE